MTEEKIIDPNITSDDKLWALLAYLFTPIIPIVLMLMDDKKERPFLKAHYMQALVWGLIVGVVSALLAVIVVGGCIGLAGLVLNIIWGIKAYNGEYVEIPVITDFVKKQGWV
ncbi:MAG: DUF4870 domain-containing protein [Chloroflexota bacterium]